MVNVRDLHTTQYGITQIDQIVDSYDMIKGIIGDFEGKVNFKMKPDSTLPLIKGDPQLLKLLFMDFFRKAIGLFNGLSGEVNITHIKDPKFWVFVFLTEGLKNGQQEISNINTMGCISKLDLSILKKPNHKQSYILYI